MIDPNSPANSWGWTIGFVLLTPVVSLILLYLNAAVTHGVALLLGQSKRGFPATFAACAYSCAPLVLLAVSFIGATPARDNGIATVTADPTVASARGKR